MNFNKNIFFLCVLLLHFSVSLICMEFNIIDFYQDNYDRYNHSYAENELLQNSEFLLVIKTNFSLPFEISEAENLKKLESFPSTYIALIKTNLDSLIISKENYKTKVFQLPSKIKPAEKYVIEIESIETYNLEIDFDPPNGTALLNNKKYIFGQSIYPGGYTLTYTKPGYITLIDTIIVSEDNFKFSYQLKPEPKKSLTINSIPANAEVFLDNEKIGVTPLTIELATKNYDLQIHKQLYQPISKQIEIKNVDLEKDYSLTPVSFILSVRPEDADVILEDLDGEPIKLNIIDNTFFANPQSDYYNLIIKKNRFDTIKERIYIEESYDKDISLIKSTLFISKLRNKLSKDIEISSYNLSNFGFNYYLSFPKQYSVKSTYFSYGLYQNHKRNYLYPFILVEATSVTNKENSSKIINSPIFLGSYLNLLGDPKINIKPYLGFQAAAQFDNDGIYFSNWGYRYGLLLQLWLTRNLGLGMSYEKEENYFNHSTPLTKFMKSSSRIKLSLEYKLNYYSLLDNDNYGIDQLQVLKSFSLKKSNFSSQGLSYNPLAMIKNKEQYFILPYASFEKLLFSHDTDNSNNFNMLTTNLGLQIELHNSMYQQRFYSAAGWAPFWSSSDNLRNVKLDSYVLRLGASLDYHQFIFRKFLNVGIEYVNFRNNNKLESENNFLADSYIFLKVGVNFYKIRPKFSLINNRMISNWKLSLNLDKLYISDFESNIGGTVSKYFEKHKSVIQEVSLSYSHFENSDNLIKFLHLGYGIGTNLSRNYSFDIVPIIKLNYSPFHYKFDETFLLTEENCKDGEIYDNFTWSYGLSFKTGFSKFGLSWGYEKIQPIQEKYNVLHESKEFKLISSNYNLGIFYIF